MLLKSLENIPTFVAGDQTILREVIHPDHDSLNLPYSLAHARILPGQQSLAHRLVGAELYIFLAGQGRMTIESQQREVKAADVVLVPEGQLQFVENTGTEDLEFYCIVSPAWRAEEEEITQTI